MFLSRLLLNQEAQRERIQQIMIAVKEAMKRLPIGASNFMRAGGSAGGVF
jgi:hypothetical protein